LKYLYLVTAKQVAKINDNVHLNRFILAAHIIIKHSHSQIQVTKHIAYKSIDCILSEISD